MRPMRPIASHSINSFTLHHRNHLSPSGKERKTYRRILARFVWDGREEHNLLDFNWLERQNPSKRRSIDKKSVIFLRAGAANSSKTMTPVQIRQPAQF
jgi:hypothetical protein